MQKRALLVYPKFPVSFWGFEKILDFGLSPARPPLGLLTIAALFPKEWDIRVVDMNVRELTREHLLWVKDAGAVFVSAMVVQKHSLYDVVSMCAEEGVPTVVGGPYATSYHKEIAEETRGDVSHFVLGEVEKTFADFLLEFENGTAAGIYPEPPKPSLSSVPIPRYDLVNLRDYVTASVQFTRGCPFDCEFCDITALYGRVPRTKSIEQVLAELQSLYMLGFRGDVEFVDDNFIGNKRDAKRILERVADWQAERGYPFVFSTEASMNIVDIPGMLTAMRRAGFKNIFTGIESTNLETLKLMRKVQNVSHTEGESKGDERDIVEDVHRIQKHGIGVYAGFILGSDGDDGSVFANLVEFIRRAGIPVAMVGLLHVLKETRLFKRLQGEGRLFGSGSPSGNNVSLNGALNFVPELNREVLIAGFKSVLESLYPSTLESFFERCIALYKKQAEGAAQRGPARRFFFKWHEIAAGLRSVANLSKGPTGPYYRRFLWRVLREYPGSISMAVAHGMIGYHLQWMTAQIIAADDLAREIVGVSKRPIPVILEKIEAIELKYRELHEDFREHVDDALELLRTKVGVKNTPMRIAQG